MRLTTSYKMKLTGDFQALEASLAIYRQALTYLILIIDSGWKELSKCEFPNQKQRLVETWVHSTQNNQAQFDFDLEYPKLPTYLRRSAISKALGIVSSYRSNLANWEANQEGPAPKLQLVHYECPAYYKKNLFKNFDSIHQTIELKVFKNGDWVFEQYGLKQSDCTYYKRYLASKKTKRSYASEERA